MWETLSFIVKYIIESGGIWGLLLIFALCWISYREWSLNKKKPVEKEAEENFLLKEMKLIKDRQTNQVKVLESNNIKIEEISEKLKNISSILDNFSKVSKHNYEKIEQLTSQLQDVNDERIDELKEVLNSYNRTMHELSLTLQNIKFILKERLEED